MRAATLALALVLSSAWTALDCGVPRHPVPPVAVTADADLRQIEAEHVFDIIMERRAPFLERGFDIHKLEVLIPARYEGSIADWLDAHSIPGDPVYGGALPEGEHLFGMPAYFGPYKDVIVQPQADTE